MKRRAIFFRPHGLGCRRCIAHLLFLKAGGVSAALV
jgi:hypothetical protein